MFVLRGVFVGFQHRGSQWTRAELGWEGAQSVLWVPPGSVRAQICLPVSLQGLREPLAGEALGHP